MAELEPEPVMVVLVVPPVVLLLDPVIVDEPVELDADPEEADEDWITLFDSTMNGGE